MMPVQLSLLPTAADGAAPVWPTLDEAQRARVMAILARLIAQTFLASRRPTAAAQESHDDE